MLKRIEYENDERTKEEGRMQESRKQESRKRKGIPPFPHSPIPPFPHSHIISFPHYLILLILLLFLLPALLPAQSFHWAHHIGSIDNSNNQHDQILDAFVDEEDNSYVLVYYSSSNNAKLDGKFINQDEVVYNGQPFLALFSFDCEGELRWHRTLKSICVDITETMREIEHRAFMVHSNDGIAIAFSTAYTANQLRIRDQDGNEDIFEHAPIASTCSIFLDALVQFDFEGEIQWVKTPEVVFPPSATNTYYSFKYNDMTLDEEGNICILGWNKSKFTEADSVATPFPLIDTIQSYILKYDWDGNLIESIPVHMSGSQWINIYLFCRNNQFHIFGEGDVNATLNGDTIHHSYTGHPEFFARFAGTGEFIDYKKLSAHSIVGNVAFHDNHYYMGSLSWRYDFLGYTFPGSQSADQGILVKLDTNANLVWAKSIQSANLTRIFDIAFLPGNIIAIGTFTNKAFDGMGEVVFDDVPLPDYIYGRPTLAFLDAERLKFVDVITIPAPNTNSGTNRISKIVITRDNNLILGGDFVARELAVGDSLFTNLSYSGRDIFVSRYGWACGEESRWDFTGVGAYEPESQWRLFPNPAANHVNVRAPEGSNTLIQEIAVYDLLGRQLLRTAVNNAACRLEISSLPAGLYLLKITDGNGRVSAKKLVVN